MITNVHFLSFVLCHLYGLYNSSSKAVKGEKTITTISNIQEVNVLCLLNRQVVTAFDAPICNNSNVTMLVVVASTMLLRFHLFTFP